MSSPQPVAAPRRLTRHADDKWFGGVCSGLAEYLGMDVTLVRVLTALLVVFGFGTAIVAYLVAWVLVPLDSTARMPG